MTNATSRTLDSFLRHHSFTSFTLLSLVAVAVLVVAIIEQEVLRAVHPEGRTRNARILGIAIYPLSALAVALIVTRFIHLS